MLSSIPLQDIMSKKLLTLHPKDKMSRVKEIFDEYAIHHIPILVNEDLVGILSKSDFDYICHVSNNSYDRFIQDKVLQSESVDKYMTKNIYALTGVNTIGEAVEIFLENRIRCLPIIKGKKLLGMVTPFDILKMINKLK